LHPSEGAQRPGHVQGNLALIQGRFLFPGNFELVAPLASGGLAHYSRVNIDPALPWAGPETFGINVGSFDAVTMIQSNFTAGGPGNLEVIARWSGELLHFWREDVSPYIWHGPFLFPLALPESGTVRGNPAMIQGRFGTRGNFELVTPLGDGGLAHYWRDNDAPGLPWHGPAVFAQDMGLFDAVTLIQSNFASPEAPATWRSSPAPASSCSTTRGKTLPPGSGLGRSSSHCRTPVRTAASWEAFPRFSKADSGRF
jgi:hypothetical protein